MSAGQFVQITSLDSHSHFPRQSSLFPTYRQANRNSERLEAWPTSYDKQVEELEIEAEFILLSHYTL